MGVQNQGAVDVSISGSHLRGNFTKAAWRDTRCYFWRGRDIFQGEITQIFLRAREGYTVTAIKLSPNLGQATAISNHLTDLVQIELIKPLNLITLDFPH